MKLDQVYARVMESPIVDVPQGTLKLIVRLTINAVGMQITADDQVVPVAPPPRGIEMPREQNRRWTGSRRRR